MVRIARVPFWEPIGLLVVVVVAVVVMVVAVAMVVVVAVVVTVVLAVVLVVAVAMVCSVCVEGVGWGQSGQSMPMVPNSPIYHSSHQI